MPTKVGLKYMPLVDGEQFVMIIGIPQMLTLSATCLDTLSKFIT